MKNRIIGIIGMLSWTLAVASTVAADKPVDIKSALQNGLLQEEASHDYKAAAETYRGIVERFDADRAMAATAVFRLGESYRKLGDTNSAALQYQRILREFADQPILLKLSREQLGETNGAAWPRSSGVSEAEERMLREVKIMLKESPDLLFDHRQGMDYPSTAAQNGFISVLQFLMDEKVDLSRTERPLINVAANSGRMAVVDFLMDHGADPNEVRGSMPALSVAIRNGYPSIAETLLKHKADPNLLDSNGCRPLFYAVAQTNLNATKLLIRYGADVNLQASQRDSIRNDANHTVDLIPNPPSVLAQAARLGSSDLVQLFIAKGANLEAKEIRGWTPLVYALASRHEDVLEVLLQAGADPNIKFHPFAAREVSLLEFAVVEAQAESPSKMVDLLLHFHANPNLADDQQNVPLHSAVFFKPLQVEQLLKAKANLNATNDHGITPLMALLILHPQDTPTLQRLVRAGADLNKQDDQGATALFYAARGRSPVAMELLLDAGANPNLTIKKNWAPLTMLHHNDIPFEQTPLIPALGRFSPFMVLSERRPDFSRESLFPVDRSPDIASGIEILLKHGAVDPLEAPAATTNAPAAAIPAAAIPAAQLPLPQVASPNPGNTIAIPTNTSYRGR